MKVFLLGFFITVCSAGIAKRSYDCGIHTPLTQNNGTITSHAGFDHGFDYGKDMDCFWTITAPAGMHVYLWAETFDLQSGFTCYSDYLKLYDGDSKSSTDMGKFCGHGTFTPLSSQGRSLTLEFKTDTHTGYQGFKLHYNFTSDIICASGKFACANGRCLNGRYRCDHEDDCGDFSDELNCPATTTHRNHYCLLNDFHCTNGQCISSNWVCDGDRDCSDGSDESSSCWSGGHSSVSSTGCGNTSLSGAMGMVKSPHYPLHYSSNMHCVWNIEAPPSTKTMVFTFNSTLFNLERGFSSSGCHLDYVKVSANSTTGMHGPYCGRIAPASFNITGNHARVEFRSDYSTNFAGFSLAWQAQE